MFDSRFVPATGTWPPGIAAAEAIRAGSGGKRAALLGLGLLVGLAASWLKIPMSAFGVGFIGNVWALAMFGIGLLVRGYATRVAGMDIAKMYVPHGFVVGPGSSRWSRWACCSPGPAQATRSPEPPTTRQMKQARQEAQDMSRSRS
jgi:hypothetical protein